MFFLFHYLIPLRIYRRLSQFSLNFFRIIPPKWFVKRIIGKELNVINKELLQKRLIDILGNYRDFQDFAVETDTILKKANDVLNHNYDILGSGIVVLQPIDWHIDFKSGYKWPKGRFFKDYKQIDLNNSADVKVPRELSRSHHFLWLGQAYLLTTDEKYAIEFVHQVRNWIKNNPLMYTINWGCAMDVSIRAVNWIYSLNMFIDSKHIDDLFIKEVYASLFEHGYFIAANLEKGFPNSGNHYAADLGGLSLLGLLFMDTPSGRKWFNFSRDELFNEVRCQLLPSGIHYDPSISYNRLMIEIFYYSIIVLKRCGVYIPLDIRYRIQQMFDFVLHYTKPDGTAPIIGDEDNGHFLNFGTHANNDHRYLLSLAAIEYTDPRFKCCGSKYVNEVYFLYGNTSKEVFGSNIDCVDSVTSKFYPDAGFCILRHRQHYAFIVCSGTPKYYLKSASSHAHADLLSFELSIGNTTFIVDPGSFLYTSSSQERNLFRSTKMHNTITINDKDQFELCKNDLFKSNSIAKPIDCSYFEDSKYAIFTGSHDGYVKYLPSYVHKRVILFNKDVEQWVIEDYILGHGECEIKVYFHINSGISIILGDSNVVLVSSMNDSLSLKMTCNADFRLSVIDSYVSPSYGIKYEAQTLVLTARISSNCKIVTQIEIV